MSNFGVLLLILLSGCSSFETYNGVSSFTEYKKGGPYHIKVRASSISLSHYTYETALLKFGKLLDISEDNNTGGSIEIIFTSQTQSSSFGSTNSSLSSSSSGSVWFSSDSYATYSGNSSANVNTVSSSSTLEWQNSNMLIIIKDKNKKRLWTADYTYKGGWEMSSFVVNTPSEASKLCIERLIQIFKKENNI